MADRTPLPCSASIGPALAFELELWVQHARRYLASTRRRRGSCTTVLVETVKRLLDLRVYHETGKDILTFPTAILRRLCSYMTFRNVLVLSHTCRALRHRLLSLKDIWRNLTDLTPGKGVDTVSWRSLVRHSEPLDIHLSLTLRARDIVDSHVELVQLALPRASMLHLNIRHREDYYSSTEHTGAPDRLLLEGLRGRAPRLSTLIIINQYRPQQVHDVNRFATSWDNLLYGHAPLLRHFVLYHPVLMPTAASSHVFRNVTLFEWHRHTGVIHREEVALVLSLMPVLATLSLSASTYRGSKPLAGDEPVAPSDGIRWPDSLENLYLNFVTLEIPIQNDIIRRDSSVNIAVSGPISTIAMMTTPYIASSLRIPKERSARQGFLLHVRDSCEVDLGSLAGNARTGKPIRCYSWDLHGHVPELLAAHRSITSLSIPVVMWPGGNIPRITLPALVTLSVDLGRCTPERLGLAADDFGIAMFNFVAPPSASSCTWETPRLREVRLSVARPSGNCVFGRSDD